MREYYYHGGGWSALAEATVAPDEAEPEPTLQSLGFDPDPYTSLGQAGGFAELALHIASDVTDEGHPLTLSLNEPDSPPRQQLQADFAVILCPSELGMVIYVKDLPSLSALAAELQPLCGLEAQNSLFSERLDNPPADKT